MSFFQSAILIFFFFFFYVFFFSNDKNLGFNVRQHFFSALWMVSSESWKSQRLSELICTRLYVKPIDKVECPTGRTTPGPTYFLRSCRWSEGEHPLIKFLLTGTDCPQLAATFFSEYNRILFKKSADLTLFLQLNKYETASYFFY